MKDQWRDFALDLHIVDKQLHGIVVPGRMHLKNTAVKPD
jgi:hypothetical protein